MDICILKACWSFLEDHLCFYSFMFKDFQLKYMFQ